MLLGIRHLQSYKAKIPLIDFIHTPHEFVNLHLVISQPLCYRGYPASPKTSTLENYIHTN